MGRLNWWMLLGCLLLVPVMVWGAEPQAEQQMTAQEFIDSLHMQSGQIDLPNNVAQLDLTEDFRYIGPKDAKRFLEEAWGNPNGSGTLGMLLPVHTNLFGDQGWAVVISYQEDGYVSDKDAAKIDYNELLQSMQAATKKANKARIKRGFQPIELVGWATPPHYDAQAKKLYWAKDLEFGADKLHTLNYNVRILGRKGVLVLNAVSGMGQLPVVEQNMTQVLNFTNFKQGQRYADFNPDVDKVAGYGLAALIGGTIAAKAGLLAKIGAILLAAKKLIIAGIAVVGSVLGKLFRRRKVIADPPKTPDAET